MVGDATIIQASTNSDEAAVTDSEVTATATNSSLAPPADSDDPPVPPKQPVEQPLKVDELRPAFFQVINMKREAGRASGLKMAYAAWSKGSTALLISVHALAASLDVDQHLVAEWRKSQPGLTVFSKRRIPIAARKAWRFEVSYFDNCEDFDISLNPVIFPVGRNAPNS